MQQQQAPAYGGVSGEMSRSEMLAEMSRQQREMFQQMSTQQQQAYSQLAQGQQALTAGQQNLSTGQQNLSTGQQGLSTGQQGLYTGQQNITQSFGSEPTPSSMYQMPAPPGSPVHPSVAEAIALAEAKGAQAVAEANAKAAEAQAAAQAQAAEAQRMMAEMSQQQQEAFQRMSAQQQEAFAQMSQQQQDALLASQTQAVAAAGAVAPDIIFMAKRRNFCVWPLSRMGFGCGVLADGEASCRHERDHASRLANSCFQHSGSRSALHRLFIRKA